MSHDQEYRLPLDGASGIPKIQKKKPSRPGGDLLIMAEVPFRQMYWLWHPYIPMGSASMIFGPGGLGKSHIAAAIIAAVTTGGPLPGQPAPRIGPQNVLLLSAEDDAGAVLKPRLIAAGADLKRVAVPKKSFVLDPKGVEGLGGYMADAAATVCFVDPIVHYMGGKIDMNKMNEVRTLTGALHQAAMETGSAIIIIHHSRKGKGGEDYEQAAGSADFNNAVRSVLFVTRDKGGSTEMRHAKSNYSACGATVPYTIDMKTDRVIWGNPYSDSPSSGGRTKLLIQTWLKEFLKDGPVKAVDVQAAAETAGFASATLNRAKGGVAESFLIREDGVNVWWWRLL